MVPHTKHGRTLSSGGRVCRPAGQNDFVHRGPVGLGESLESRRLSAGLVAECGVIPFQLSGGILAVPGASFLLLTALRLGTGDVFLFLPIFALLLLLLDRKSVV